MALAWVFQTIPNNRMSSSPSRKRQKLGTDCAPASTLPAVLAGSNQSTNVQAKDPSTAATSSASDEGTPTLPPAVWGHVLDYLLYGEVRQAILVNKAMANEASKYVQDIYITEPCQLDVVAARRFSNVDYVQIKCLVRWPDKETCELVEETTKRAVPFLTAFMNLKEFYLGGNDKPDPDSRRTHGYSPQHCKHPITHKELMKDMMKSLCNAFRTRTLSQKVLVRGLMGDYGRTHACQPAEAVEGSPCPMCREILMTFPPSLIRALDRGTNTRDDSLGDMSSICMTPNDYATILKSRRFEENIFRDEGKNMILRILEWNVRETKLQPGDKHDDKIIERLKEKNVDPPTLIFSYDNDSIETIKSIAKNGFDPNMLTGSELHDCCDYMHVSGRIAMIDDDLEELCELGIPFDRNKISTVSEVGL